MGSSCLKVHSYDFVFYFTEMGEAHIRELCKEFPRFTESDVLDLKLQFQTFDLNQDGIIDYNEL